MADTRCSEESLLPSLEALEEDFTDRHTSPNTDEKTQILFSLRKLAVNMGKLSCAMRFKACLSHITSPKTSLSHFPLDGMSIRS